MSDPGSDRIRIHEFHEWKRSGRKYETVSEFLEVMSAEAVEYIRGVPLSKHLDRRYFHLRDSKKQLMNMKNGHWDLRKK